MRTSPVARAALITALILPLLGLIAPIARAVDADGRFAVKSVGGTKCSQFVEIIKSKNQGQIALYVGWIAGYISAANQFEGSTFDLASWQDMRTLTALLTRHCDRNADLRFGAATAQMANALKADKLDTRSDIVKIEHEGKTIALYQEALRRAQSGLAELGMFTGDLDGQFSDATRDAIVKFQEKNKIATSGVPDQQTLFALFKATRGAEK